MPRDPRAHLWHARSAAALVVDFVADRSWADYEADPLLRSGVERQFEIVGEALSQLGRDAPDLAQQVATERAAPLMAVLDDLLGAGS